MSLEAATWVTAAATIILAVLAVVTARYARRAYVAQSAQLDDQRKELQQAAAGRERDAAEWHRAQAFLVYLRREYVSPMYDLDPPQIAARVHNTSQQPVYDLRFEWHLAGQPCFMYDGRIMSLTPYVMPGAEERGIVDVPADKAAWQVDVSASFRDRAGIWWRTWPDGFLKEISEPADVTDAPPAATPATETAADVRPSE
jgi:hypothetical protein